MRASDWQKIFAEQTKGVTSAADRILGDLHGYNHESPNRAQDAEELAEALVGWRRYATLHGNRLTSHGPPLARNG